uniref:hypothetical protein n=1 Tax=Algoriphagus sp. TaxID=1872435 RepID=UPI0040487022
MKKVFAIFAIAGLIATASCGGKTTEEGTATDSTVVEEIVVEEAAAAVDTTAVEAPAAQ